MTFETETRRENDLEERMKLVDIAIEAAEKLDALERALDPHGPPPRHAALTFQRLKSVKQSSARR